MSTLDSSPAGGTGIAASSLSGDSTAAPQDRSRQRQRSPGGMVVLPHKYGTYRSVSRVVPIPLRGGNATQLKRVSCMVCAVVVVGVMVVAFSAPARGLTDDWRWQEWVEVAGQMVLNWPQGGTGGMFNSNHVVIGYRVYLEQQHFNAWGYGHSPWVASQFTLASAYAGAWVDISTQNWLGRYQACVYLGTLSNPSGWSTKWCSNPASYLSGNAYYANVVHVSPGTYVMKFWPMDAGDWSFYYTFWYDTIPPTGGGACNRWICPV